MNGLIINGLEKSYGDLKVLRNMSLHVRPGEIYGFVGSNGAGKTTTMRIALGVLAADAGEVRIGDTPMNDTLRRTVGYMPEERGLYPKEQVRKQLIYFARLHGLDSARAAANTDQLLQRLGLGERADDKVDTLSLGNQQRVQLAAALVHDPEVLILDEPFSGLDPVAVSVMSGVLKEFAERGTPIVFSSHQLDLVERLCDRVGIIRGGEMLVEGTVDELRATGPRLWDFKVDEAPSGWAKDIDGVTSTTVDEHGTTIISLADDAPDNIEQTLLHRAMKVGTVRSFAPRRIPLTELLPGGCAFMSTHNGTKSYSASTAIGTIFRRELRQNLLKKSSLITMIITIIAVVGGVIAADYFINKTETESTTSIAVVGEAPFARVNGVELAKATDENSARAAVSNDDVDAALVPDTATGSWKLLSKDNPPTWLAPQLQESLREQTQAQLIQQLGGDPAQFEKQVKTQQISVVSVDQDDSANFPAVMVSLVGIILMMMAIFIFGGAVAMSVIEEKSSRVIEILLATVRPLHLLAGKILGAALAGLIMMVAIVASGSIAMAVTGLSAVVEIQWSAVAVLIPCFVLGYLFFAALYAAAGSLVSRMEDFQGAQTPVMVLAFAAMYVPLFGWQNLDSTFMQIAAWIPPVSVTTAPMQYAVGNMNVWELIATLAIMAVSVVAVGALAAKIYPRNVLHTGSAISWKKALAVKS